jgi:hypothetical protein
MDLGAGDLRATRLGMPGHPVDGQVDPRGASLGEALSELPRGAAARI